jgi:superfamily II DNA or RNA helicase
MIRVLVQGIRDLLKRDSGVRSVVVLTQIVLMTQMKYDILGKPWTWSDLSPIELDDAGFVNVGSCLKNMNAQQPKGKRKTAQTKRGLLLEPVSGKRRRNTIPDKLIGTVCEDAVDVTCPLSGVSLLKTLPQDIVRAVCVQPPPLVRLASEVSDVSVGDGTTESEKETDNDKSKTRKQPGKCRRFVSKAAYQAWLEQSSAERAARALDASLICPSCGGHFGGAAAWDIPSPPKDGWAPSARVGWLQGAYLDSKGRRSKKCVWEDCDIVLVSAKSAADCDYPWATFGIGAAAVDEAHKLGSPSLSQILPRIPCKFVFGVSATPARLDGSEHALGWQLGPYAYVYQRTEAVTGMRGTVRVRQVLYRRGSHEEVFYRDGRLGFATMINILALDAERNALILALAEAAVAAGRKKILVITSTLVHTAYLVRALREQCGFYDAAVLTGGAKKETVSYAQNPLCRVVVATYHFLSEGYDDAHIDTMILAAPRSNVQQAVGRCERVMEGKLVPLVFDVVDTFSAFEGMAWKRHAFFKSRAFSIRREEEEETWRDLRATGPALVAAFRGGSAADDTDDNNSKKIDPKDPKIKRNAGAETIARDEGEEDTGKEEDMGKEGEEEFEGEGEEEGEGEFCDADLTEIKDADSDSDSYSYSDSDSDVE